MFVVIDSYKLMPCPFRKIFDHACFPTTRRPLDKYREPFCRSSSNQVKHVPPNGWRYNIMRLFLDWICSPVHPIMFEQDIVRPRTSRNLGNQTSHVLVP